MSNGFINVKHRFYARNTFLRSEKLERMMHCVRRIIFFVQDVLYWDDVEISEILWPVVTADINFRRQRRRDKRLSA